jgi:hypothetical protein
MTGMSSGDLPGGRFGRRRREIIAAAAALAVVLAVVMAGCGSQGSPGTRASPASSSASPAPSPTGTAGRLHRLTDRELRAWAAARPRGPVPDVPALAGRQGHYLLVDRGRRVPVPAGAGQLYVWWRTPYGLVTPLLGDNQAGVGYSDDYWGSHIVLLRPDGRLVQIGHGLMGGVATDPTGRYVAWLQAPAKKNPNTVHVVDLAAMREVARFDEPAFSTLRGFVQAGILIEKGPGFVVRSLDGREVRHRQRLEGAAGNRLLVREGNCLRVIELGSAFRTAPFSCGTPPLVALSPDGTWMLVDGVAVDVATLTRHATLMPAGTHEPDPIMFPLGPKQLLVKVYDSNYHTIAAAACDLPAGRCQKVPVPFFGPIW